MITDIDFHTLHHPLDHIYWFSYTTSCTGSYIDFHRLHHAFDHIYWFSYTTSCNWSYILIFIHYIMQLIIYWFSYTTSCTGSYIDFHTLHHALDHIYWFSYAKSCTWSYILIFILQDTFFIFVSNCIMQLTMYIDFHTLITYKSWHSLYLYIIHWLTLSWRRPLSYRTSPSICSENQWTGFYMITASVLKGLTFTTGHVFYFCKQ